MTVYRGLDHGMKGGHFAVHSFLSGVLNSEAQNRPGGNVTIDQFIADEIGFQTRFPSLTVGSEGGIHGGCQIAWTKSGVRVPPITGPAELFDRLFVSDSQERQDRRNQENRLQASILDTVLGEANRLSKRVNREDKDKLDEYFTSIRDVEKRLELRQRWASLPKPKPPFDRPANKNEVEDLPMLYELIALALQTDSTRIATLEIGGDFLPQNLGIDKAYHGLSHHGNDEEAIKHLITLETYQIEHFGEIPHPPFQDGGRRADVARLDDGAFRQRHWRCEFAQELRPADHPRRRRLQSWRVQEGPVLGSEQGAAVQSLRRHRPAHGRRDRVVRQQHRPVRLRWAPAIIWFADARRAFEQVALGSLCIARVSPQPRNRPRQKVISQFVGKYCLKCHDVETQKGDREFESFKLPLAIGGGPDHGQGYHRSDHAEGDAAQKGEASSDRRRAARRHPCPARGHRCRARQDREHRRAHGDAAAFEPRIREHARDALWSSRGHARAHGGFSEGEDERAHRHHRQVARHFRLPGGSVFPIRQSPRRDPPRQARRWSRSPGTSMATFVQYEELSGPHKAAFNYQYLCLYEQPNTDTRQGGYGHIEDFLKGVPVSGLYDIEVQAQAMHRDTHYDPTIFGIDFSEPFLLGVVPGDATKNHIHYPQAIEPLLAQATVPDDKPEWLKFRVWLEAGQTPRFIFPNGPYESRASVITINKRYADDFQGKFAKAGVGRTHLFERGKAPAYPHQRDQDRGSRPRARWQPGRDRGVWRAGLSGGACARSALCLWRPRVSPSADACRPRQHSEDL